MYLFILSSYVGFILVTSLDVLRKMNIRWRYLQCFVVPRGSSPKLMSESLKVVSWGQFDSDHPNVTSVLSKVIQVSEFILLSCRKQRRVTEEFIFILWEVQPRNLCFVFWDVQSCNRGISILLWEVPSFNRGIPVVLRKVSSCNCWIWFPSDSSDVPGSRFGLVKAWFSSSPHQASAWW
jgi:hypothetical protein